MAQDLWQDGRGVETNKVILSFGHRDYPCHRSPSHAE